MLGIVADGEAASEQLWAVQQQVAGIAALCGGDCDVSATLLFSGELGDHASARVAHTCWF